MLAVMKRVNDNLVIEYCHIYIDYISSLLEEII